MDQIKIGRFIAECRKKKSLTQMQLAERLNITDRAVSKWETGRAMPDSSIMLALCQELEITVNDLLNGEVVAMDQYNETMEKNMLEMVKQKEAMDRHLLSIEILIGILCLCVLLPLVLVAGLTPMEEWLQVTLVLIGLLPLLIATPFMLRIEQKAGYYECSHCHHKYVPAYGSVFAAMHFGRTRYMRCPHCQRRSWQKKVIRKD